MESQSKNPKILHRIYFENFKPFHDPFLHYLDSWRRELPEYKIMLWGPHNLDVNAIPWTRIANEKKSPVFLSEYFRWKVLAEYGGVYLDADCEMLDGPVFHRITEELFSQNTYDCFFGVEEASNGHPTAQTFGAKKGSKLVQFMLDLYENRLEPLWHWREMRGLIGPQLLSLYFRNRDINVADDGFFKNLHEPVVSAGAKVYPQKFFSPKFSLAGEVLDYEEGSTCVYHMFANSNVDFSANKRLDAERDRALTFAEYRAQIEKSSKFPRNYHASHFSVRDAVMTDDGVHGKGTGLLMYGPYVALPGGDYLATIECAQRPKKGKVVVVVTAESGAVELGRASFEFPASAKRALQIPFAVPGKVANMCEVTVALEGVDRILVKGVVVDEAGRGPSAASPDQQRSAVPQAVSATLSKPNLKRIHRIYFGFDGKPDPYGRYLETWQKHLPDFEILHWNAHNLPMDANDYVRTLYREKDHAFLTDYFRWYLLREYGGTYFDADLEVVNGSSYSTIISELEVASDFDAIIGIDEKSGGWYTAHSMASKAGGELATFMCEVYENFGKFTAWRKRGMYFWAPQLVGLYFADRGFHKEGMGTLPHLDAPTVVEGVKVYPQDWFSPLAPTGNAEKPFDLSGYSQNTALCHHFACSWHDEGSIYLSYSQQHGGQARTLLREIVAAEGRSVMTEHYRADAMHMSFVPSGGRLLNEIGKRHPLGLVTDQNAGYLVYGLSQPLAAGRYRMSFHLTDIAAAGRASIEVVSDGGSKSHGLLETEISTQSSSGVLYCLIDLQQGEPDLDCRLMVDGHADFVMSELTIDRIG